MYYDMDDEVDGIIFGSEELAKVPVSSILIHERPYGRQAMLNVPTSRREVELRLPALPHRGVARPTTWRSGYSVHSPQVAGGGVPSRVALGITADAGIRTLLIAERCDDDYSFGPK